MDTPTKTCNACGGTFPLSSFYAHRETRDGHVGKCKACCKEYAMYYYNSYKSLAADFSRDWEKNKRRNWRKHWTHLRREETKLWGHPLTCRERQKYLLRQEARKVKAAEVLSRRERRETVLYGRPLTPGERRVMLTWGQWFKKTKGYYPPPDQKRTFFRSSTALPLDKDPQTAYNTTIMSGEPAETPS